ncbi:uncharacterized protein LOC133883373 [Phragmites australis]|uniref:uncharacterized protein LOC133883373 n=1 Tax=Phragmites australis TaxID=29695 RepID=UPI002D76785B|nr:uncharacterized protein LOC133883373 [Phragmites australis]
MHPPNYTRWRELFLALVGKFGASRHIDDTIAPNPPDVAWQTVDYAVLSLLYATVSEEIMAIVLKPDAATYAIWHEIEGLFRDNKVSHALSLEVEFHSLAQGDLSILTYSQKFMTYADALANIDQPVPPDTLVLTLLRGLNDPFRNIATIIKTKTPFSSFLESHSMLLLEEADLKIARSNTSTALVTTNSGSSAQVSSKSSFTSSSSGGSTNTHRQKGKGKGITVAATAVDDTPLVALAPRAAMVVWRPGCYNHPVA